MKTQYLRNWTKYLVWFDTIKIIAVGEFGTIKIDLPLFMFALNLCGMGLPKIAVLLHTVHSVASYD